MRLYVNVTSCPTGFEQRNEDIEQGCDCIDFLGERGVICRISDSTFELAPPLWIGYDNTSQLIFPTILVLLTIVIQAQEFLQVILTNCVNFNAVGSCVAIVNRV